MSFSPPPALLPRPPAVEPPLFKPKGRRRSSASFLVRFSSVAFASLSLLREASIVARWTGSLEPKNDSFTGQS